jgi:enamine deaminase RidA (YjgF/YER057c/UK114 family)
MGSGVSGRTPEDRLAALGLTLPDFTAEGYYGTGFGPMKPHHIVGPVLHLSGHVPIQHGEILFPGRLGETVTVDQGYAAAQLTGLNAAAGMKHALGDLSRVRGIIKCLCFVACAPDFTDVHKVSSGLSDRLTDIFGQEIGLACRATIGVQSLAGNLCFETWMEVEIDQQTR